MSARLYELNGFIKKQITDYETACQAPTPNSGMFKSILLKVTETKQDNRPLNNVNFKANLSALLTNESLFDKEHVEKQKSDRKKNEKPKQEKQEKPNLIFDWSYLQIYPANFDYMNQINDLNDQSINLVSLIWYKPLNVNDNLHDDKMVAIAAIKTCELDIEIKLKPLSAEKVNTFYDR